MSQKHDIGRQKRDRPHRPRDGRIDGGRLARDLVNRGLADPNILGHIGPYRRTSK